LSIRLNQRFLPYDHIRLIATGLLDQYKHRIGPPVQIEQIVEIELGMEITPIAGLHNDFDIDGFMSSDLREIFIDLGMMEQSNDNRYRFTLAHEVGHVVMHKQIFTKFKIYDVDGYKQFLKDVNESDRGYLENQAYNFAGLLLVPEYLLKEEFERQLNHKDLREEIRVAKKYGLKGVQYREHVAARMAEKIARYFHVSTEVVDRRIDKDGLIASIP